MKLSIIVPVYNAAGYLSRCVDSLLAQKVSPMEIILVNDGSKDNSLDIMKRYEARYPDIIRTLDLSNGGQGRARNHALEIARGEYVGFADSDDWASDEMFSRLVSVADSEQADVVVCDSWRVEENGTFYEKACPQDHPLAAAGSVWNKLIRRSLIGEIRFPEGVWYEDFSFTAKILIRSGKTIFLPEPLYNYRSGHPSTMRNQNSRKNLDILTVMDGIIAFFGSRDRNKIEFLLINHILLDAIKRVNLQNSPDKKQVIAKLREYVQNEIPDLTHCESFQRETRNRRIIMFLNYHGLEDVSKVLLEVKAKKKP